MQSINEQKIFDFLKNVYFGVKQFFQEFSNFSKSFGLILLAPLAFWKLSIWTSCSCILSINDFKGPLNAKNVFNFESFN